MSATKTLVLDIDGVVSPVHPDPHRPAWGDEIVVGNVFGPVLVSAELCRRLDELAQRPDLVCVWLTSWTPQMRMAMDPFPGRNWTDLGQQYRSTEAASEAEWWKWDALRCWLDAKPGVRRLVWCDDDLELVDLVDVATDVEEEGQRHDKSRSLRSSIEKELLMRHIVASLIAPAKHVGLSPEDLRRAERFLDREP